MASVFKDLEKSNDEAADILALIASAVQAIASTRGLASDLRVTVVANPTTAVTISSGTVTTVTTVATVTNQAQMGGLALNSVVPNWQNQTAVQSFTNNIVR